MVWSKKYETGNDTVDRDHKEIFALVKKLLDETITNRKDRIDEAINFLTSYTVRHFLNEEKLMNDYDYPNTEEHKTEHRDFADTITTLHSKYMNEGETMDISIEVNKTIVGWLVEHVLGSDRQLVNHIQAVNND